MSGADEPAGAQRGVQLLEAAQREPSRDARRALAAFMQDHPPPPHSPAERLCATVLLVDGARVRWRSTERSYVTHPTGGLSGSPPGRPTSEGDVGTLRLSPNRRDSTGETTWWYFDRDDGYDAHGVDALANLGSIFASAEDVDPPATRPDPCGAARDARAALAREHAQDQARRRRKDELTRRGVAHLDDEELSELGALCAACVGLADPPTGAAVHDERVKRARADHAAAEQGERDRRSAAGLAALKGLRGNRRKAWRKIHDDLCTLPGVRPEMIGLLLYETGICTTGAMPPPEDELLAIGTRLFGARGGSTSVNA